MGSTAKTPNYQLPQFVATDKPTWLGDVNKAMLDIDTGIAEARTTGAGAEGVANTAIATANTALENSTNNTASIDAIKVVDGKLNEALTAKQLFWTVTANATANSSNYCLANQQIMANNINIECVEPPPIKIPIGDTGRSLYPYFSIVGNPFDLAVSSNPNFNLTIVARVSANVTEKSTGTKSFGAYSMQAYFDGGTTWICVNHHDSTLEAYSIQNMWGAGTWLNTNPVIPG